MDLFKHLSAHKQHENPHEIRPDVLALNEIERYGLVSPRDPQDLGKSREVKFAFLPDDKVLLLASVDGWFPYWASVTDVDDVATNAAIADAVLFGDFSAFTSTYPKLENLMSHRYRRWFHVSGGHIKTPFEYGFSEEPDQVQNWGRWLATSVSRHYREIRELCRLRGLDGRYLPLLRSYLEMLDARTSDDDARNYEDKRMLIKLLASEDYLYVSDDEEMRSTYVEARKKIDSLHSLYMSIANSRRPPTSRVIAPSREFRYQRLSLSAMVLTCPSRKGDSIWQSLVVVVPQKADADVLAGPGTVIPGRAGPSILPTLAKPVTGCW